MINCVLLSEYVFAPILSMYSDINCLPASSSDKRCSVIESSTGWPDTLLQSFAGSSSSWNGFRKVLSNTLYSPPLNLTF